MANDIASVKIDCTAVEIGTPCLICGESVPVFGGHYAPKICEKCKAAVMKVRAEDGKK